VGEEFFVDPITEAQRVRFGPGSAHRMLFASEGCLDITWADLARMGYTPRSLFKMIRGYVDLVEGRRKIIETNTRLTEENRVLKERLDAKG
jgi:hypothetical protein